MERTFREQLRSGNRSYRVESVVDGENSFVELTVEVRGARKFRHQRLRIGAADVLEVVDALESAFWSFHNYVPPSDREPYRSPFPRRSGAPRAKREADTKPTPSRTDRVPTSPPKPPRQRPPWTAEEDAQLRMMMAEGMNAAAISRALDRYAGPVEIRMAKLRKEDAQRSREP